MPPKLQIRNRSVVFLLWKSKATHAFIQKINVASYTIIYCSVLEVPVPDVHEANSNWVYAEMARNMSSLFNSGDNVNYTWSNVARNKTRPFGRLNWNVLGSITLWYVSALFIETWNFNAFELANDRDSVPSGETALRKRRTVVWQTSGISSSARDVHVPRQLWKKEWGPHLNSARASLLPLLHTTATLVQATWHGAN